MGREAGGHEEPADLGLAEDELVVRGERLRPVDDAVDAGVGHRRDAPDRALHDRLEAGHVGREQLAVEVRRDAVERPGRRVPLVAAHAQPAHLLAEVHEVVRVAQLGQPRMHALDRLGEQVLVRHRDDRNGHPGHPADLGGEHPAGVDDDIGPDLRALAAVLDGHAGDAATFDADRGHPRVRPDRRAARARAGGEGLGQTGRVEPAVRGQVDRAEDAIGRHQREEVASLGGRDRARAAARTSWPSPPAGAAPRTARATTPAGASPPRARTDRRRSRRPAAGTAPPRTSSSGSG